MNAAEPQAGVVRIFAEQGIRLAGLLPHRLWQSTVECQKLLVEK
jgi:hypothetical protein